MLDHFSIVREVLVEVKDQVEIIPGRHIDLAVVLALEKSVIM